MIQYLLWLYLLNSNELLHALFAKQQRIMACSIC